MTMFTAKQTSPSVGPAGGAGSIHDGTSSSATPRSPPLVSSTRSIGRSVNRRPVEAAPDADAQPADIDGQPGAGGVVDQPDDTW